jgi:NhaP-type Na+/H+ and K+/H+ antiporter
MAVKLKAAAYIVPVIMGAAFGVYYTVNSIAVNKAIESEIRASLLSLQHALTKIVQMIIFALLGLVVDKYPLNTSILFIAVIVAAGIFTVVMVYRGQFKNAVSGIENERGNSIL